MDFPVIRRAARSVETAMMAVLPHGGQGAARRNAWSAMAADAIQSRARREADLAMDRAVSRSAARAAHPSATGS
jgi:hypothetical protein